MLEVEFKLSESAEGAGEDSGDEENKEQVNTVGRQTVPYNDSASSQEV